MRSHFTVAAIFLLAAPTAGWAQSALTGNVTGSVTDVSGQGVPRALISVTTSAGAAVRQLNTGSAGGFALDQLLPGTYQLRIEAIGYRPLVARGLTIGGGETRALSFQLVQAEPAAATIDTISLSGGSSARLQPGATQLVSEQLTALPHRLADLASAVSLSTAFDPALGSQGLPGDMTLLYVDGLPVYRAPHPTARAEVDPSPLFPGSALSGAHAYHTTGEIEWAGSAGGVVSGASRVSSQGVGVHAAFSGGPGWSSGELDVPSPSVTSFDGGLVGAVALNEEGAQLTFSGAALRHQTPLTPRVPESLATSLTGVDPELLTALSEPATETFSRYSGLFRVDMPREDGGRIFIRGAGAFTERAFEGAGPLTIGPVPTMAGSSIDYSIVGGLLTQASPTTTLELRAGVSGSNRDFDPAIDGVPPAFLVEPGATLGNPAAGAGSSDRTDVVLTPVLHLRPSYGQVKLGAVVRASNHTFDHTVASGGDFLFTDAAALLSGDGFGAVSSGGESSFSTQEFGFFAQLSNASPTLRTSLGARYDYERIPISDVGLNADWLAATGIANADVPGGFNQLGVRASLTWDPSASGRTLLSAVLAAQQGDVDARALHELLSRDGDATTRRFAGAGVDWPAGSVPGSTSDLPALTLMGPDTRPPRTMGASAGLTQLLAEGTSLQVGGSFRRTDFLLRRRNLNLPLAGQAADPNGRVIYGTLDQDGALVTTTADDARRFSAFGDVYALDPDGWSEYWGVTVSLEHGADRLRLFGSYTYSETTDNWIGAASGHPSAELSPGVPAGSGEEWGEGTSDFDVPHRAVAGLTVDLGAAALSGVYRFSSGMPFTPRYRYGVDANGDGSQRNDVAFVPGDAQLAAVLDDWPCLEDQAAAFATRNSCRAPDRHAVDVRLEIRFGRLGGRDASIYFDGLNLIEDTGGILDEALLIVDPAASLTTSPDGSTVTIPVNVNPGFGQVLYPTSRGRMIRLGVRFGS